MVGPVPHSKGGAAKRRIRVLIVDDSALVRSILTEMLARDPAIEVVGSAGDAHIAREKIKQLNPDVLTLDVEMPKMDGLTFLKNLMRLRPMPVVMVSSLTERGADVTLDALALGAVDFLSKPKIDIAATLRDYADELIEKVKVAASASVRALAAVHPPKVPPSLTADAVLAQVTPPRRLRTTERIIAIGASTGGTEAIKQVLIAGCDVHMAGHHLLTILGLDHRHLAALIHAPCEGRAESPRNVLGDHDPGTVRR